MTTGSASTANSDARPAVSWKVHLRRQSAIVSRWLHIYLSMVSFAVVLFFSASGLTLNHPDWFASQQRTVVKHGVADAALLGKGAAHGGAAGSNQIDKLGLVEMLRSREHVHGAVGEVRIDDSQVSISLRAPGYTADTYIDRDTGKYELTEVSSGFVAVVNDLHKGRDSGKVWAFLIDASAVLLVLVSLTGFVLLWFMHKRRTSGFLLALVGAIAVVTLYKLYVP